MELELLKFIKENQDWKQLIQEKPFSINIKENDDYMIFVYSMIDSDFSLPIVKECRGIILRKRDYKPVCIPFFKFHNVQETLASEIDWNSARVQEKIDGSLIKLWFDNGSWHVSTNGTIDAKEAGLSADFSDQKTFYDLFCSADNVSYDLNDGLNSDNTYMFELVSPFNRVVVPYTKTEVYHIGTRNNITLKELNEDIGIKKPKEYNLYSLDDCLKAVEILPFSEEGYVVVDKFWNRVKIKSPAYVAAHHLKNNGVITYSRVIDMIRANGQDDFVSIYPEYKDIFDKVENGIRNFVGNIEKDWDEFEKSDIFNSVSRKDVALYFMKKSCPAFMFSFYDKKTKSLDAWLESLSSDKLLEWINIRS